MTRNPSIYLTAAAILFCQVASAQESSSQPYIDLLKQGMEPVEPSEESVTGESFIETQKKKIQASDAAEPTELSEPSDGYSDRIKAQIQAQEAREGEAPEAEGSYTAREKAKLGPGPETGGAIQAFKEGRSELRARREGKIRNALVFKVGAISTRDISSGGRSIDQVYSNGWVPDFQFTYEYQPFNSEWYGSLGLVLGAGISVHRGYGRFSFELPNAGGGAGATFPIESRTRMQFITAPFVAGLNYRMNLLRFIRPYVQATPALITYFERRSDGGSLKTGYSPGVIIGGGLNIPVGWLDENNSSALYDLQGVKRYHLTVDYTLTQSFSGPVSYNNSTFSAGLTYEF